MSFQDPVDDLTEHSGRATNLVTRNEMSAQSRGGCMGPAKTRPLKTGVLRRRRLAEWTPLHLCCQAIARKRELSVCMLIGGGRFVCTMFTSLLWELLRQACRQERNLFRRDFAATNELWKRSDYHCFGALQSFVLKSQNLKASGGLGAMAHKSNPYKKATRSSRNALWQAPADPIQT